MKHYFLIAKDVGDLTAILCAKLENSQAKAMPVLSRMMARFRPRARHTLSESEDFVVDYNRINVADENVFKLDPVTPIRIFHIDHHDTVHEHLLRCIGALSAIEAGRAEDAKFATELMRTSQPRHRDLLYVALFLHDIAKGRIEDHSIAGARIARNFCPWLGFS